MVNTCDDLTVNITFASSVQNYDFDSQISVCLFVCLVLNDASTLVGQ